MKPTTAYLTVRAQEDLAALIDENITTHPELEWGGIIIGSYDADKGRVTIEQLRRNLFVQPYSTSRTTTDTEAMAVLDQEGRRVIGDWHTHPFSEPIKASEADYKGWRRAGTDLGEPVYLGMIFAPISTWWEGVPRDSWEEPPAPQIAAWAATPKGAMHSLTLTKEPEWYARLRSQVRFRPERSTSG